MPDLQIVLRGLTKYENYVVRIAYTTSLTSGELDVQTPCRDVNEAIEWARIWFHQFGANMAMALERPGSLV